MQYSNNACTGTLDEQSIGWKHDSDSESCTLWSSK